MTRFRAKVDRILEPLRRHYRAQELQANTVIAGTVYGLMLTAETRNPHLPDYARMVRSRLGLAILAATAIYAAVLIWRTSRQRNPPPSDGSGGRQDHD